MRVCGTNTSSSARFKLVSNYNIKSTERMMSGSEIFDLLSSFKEILHALC